MSSEGDRVLSGQAAGGQNLTPEHTSLAPLSAEILDFCSKAAEVQADDLRRSDYLHRQGPTDTSFPLNQYFISSSHNTYLEANQLTGNASPERRSSATAEILAATELGFDTASRRVHRCAHAWS